MTSKGQSLLLVFLLMKSVFSLQMSSGIVKNPNSNTTVNFDTAFTQLPAVGLVNLMQFSIESLNINKNSHISIVLDAADITKGRFILSAAHSGFEKSFVLQAMYFASIGDPCIIGSLELNMDSPMTQQSSFTKLVFSSPKFHQSTTRVNVSTILSSYDFTISDISLGIGLSVQASHQICKDHNNCSYPVPLKTNKYSPLSTGGGLKFSVTPKGISVTRLVIVAVILTIEKKGHQPLLINWTSVSVSKPNHEGFRKFTTLDDRIIGRGRAFYGEQSFSVDGTPNSNIITVQKLNSTSANSSKYQVYLYLSCQANQIFVNNSCNCSNINQILTKEAVKKGNFCRSCPPNCITCRQKVCLTFHLKKISIFDEVGTVCDRGFQFSKDKTYCECRAPFIVHDDGFCNCSNPIEMYFNTELQKCVCKMANRYEDNGVCKRCWAVCQTCVGPSPSNCTSCIDSTKFDLNNSVCVCKPGLYFLNFVTCDNCSETCLTCVSKNSCSSCHSTHNRVYVRGKCICKEGYFDSNSTICQSCDSSCLSCNGPKQCTRCAQGKYLRKGICNSCDPSCVACTSHSPKSCTKCPSGQYLLAGTCDRCGPSCLNCDWKNPNFCLGCPQGKYLVDGECNPCHSTCLTCNSTNCLSCKPDENRVLSGGECRCSEGYEEGRNEKGGGGGVCLKIGEVWV